MKNSPLPEGLKKENALNNNMTVIETHDHKSINHLGTMATNCFNKPGYPQILF